jgi:hypothetical protein
MGAVHLTVIVGQSKGTPGRKMIGTVCRPHLQIGQLPRVDSSLTKVDMNHPGTVMGEGRREDNQ